MSTEKFWRKMKSFRAALLRRAWEMKKYAESKWAKAPGLQLVGDAYVPRVADFGACLRLAWEEFSEESQWISVGEAAKRSGYTSRRLRMWLSSPEKNGKYRLVGALVNGCWMVNVNSLELLLAEQALDPGTEYMTVAELASALGCSERAVQWQVKQGKRQAVYNGGKLYIVMGRKNRRHVAHG